MTTMTMRSVPWRWIGWGGAAALLALPAIAMRFTTEVNWTASDFAVFAVMLLTAGGVIELLMRRGRGFAYRLAAGITGITAFLLVWVNLAVGIIGSEDDPANFLFVAVFATAFAGTMISRFRAAGMALTLLTTAAVQGAVAAIAVATGMGSYTEIWPRDVIGGSVFFCLLWCLAAALFHAAAAHGQGPQA